MTNVSPNLQLRLRNGVFCRCDFFFSRQGKLLIEARVFFFLIYVYVETFSKSTALVKSLKDTVILLQEMFGKQNSFPILNLPQREIDLG